MASQETYDMFALSSCVGEQQPRSLDTDLIDLTGPVDTDFVASTPYDNPSGVQVRSGPIFPSVSTQTVLGSPIGTTPYVSNLLRSGVGKNDRQNSRSVNFGAHDTGDFSRYNPRLSSAAGVGQFQNTSLIDSRLTGDMIYQSDHGTPFDQPVVMKPARREV